MSTCPRCHRPINEGNSPNVEECHAGDLDDEDRNCELSATIYALRCDLAAARGEIERLREALDLTTDRLVFYMQNIPMDYKDYIKTREGEISYFIVSKSISLLKNEVGK